MKPEIFRFAVLRASEAIPQQDLSNNSIILSKESPLIEGLRQARGRNSRTDMVKLAKDYVKGNKFISSSSQVDKRLLQFADALIDRKTIDYNAFIRQRFQDIFNATPAAFAGSADYTNTLHAVTDSIVAAAIDTAVSAKTKFILQQLARSLKGINDLKDAQPVSRHSMQLFKILLPQGIFPLPLVDSDLKDHRTDQIKNRKELEIKLDKQKKELLQEINNSNEAIKELLDTFDTMKPATRPRTTGSTRTARAARAASGAATEGASAELSKISGFVLAKNLVTDLKNPVKETLKKTGLPIDELDVAKAIPLLEKRASDASKKLYNQSPGRRMFRIGNTFAPVFDFDLAVFEPVRETRNPGPCPPTGITSDMNDDAKPLVTSGKHEVRVLGIADLMLVEQELDRYELGEISHIENVLKSEFRDRKHTVKQANEEIVTTETEESELKEKDLSSTERFELQTEAQKVIDETTSIEAGVSVTASYGPVSTTANFNYSNTNSVNDSQRVASTFARETTSKAVNKIENRSLQRTTRRSLREVEELNQHTFDNKLGGDHISGVYRFVNKIYKAQIVNYGKRLMLEFMVPEPSAFLRYALTRQSFNTNGLEIPDAPGYCLANGKSFVPLTVQDIDRYNYMYWTSKYNVEDVQPPPPQTLVTSTSVISGVKDMEMWNEGDSKEWFNNKTISVDIPEGYRPVNADVVIDAMLNIKDEANDTAFVHLLIDKQMIEDNGHSIVNFSSGTWQNVAAAINTWNKVSYAAVLNVFSRLTEEREQKWKINTYNSIINAYQDQLTKYNNALEAERIRMGFSEIRGSNPFVNRETEKTELKKNCIAMLTGQRFDSFDAMNWNVAPEGYPEIDFEEAAKEGNFIAFFEQAFEWNNMIYIFYPYFWANKKEWVTLSQINDDDIQFTRFLQAGAARVSIPVRPGFETSMMNYLDTNIIWSSEGTLVNTEDGEPNPLHVSIVEELKSQLNNNSIDGSGRIDVVKDSKDITGTGTEFLEEDEDKRIIIGGVTYIIKEFLSATAIKLTTSYKGETENGIRYSYGAKLVGEPWDVRLPTNLVKLDTESAII